MKNAIDAVNSVAAKQIADYGLLSGMGQGSEESARLMVTHRHSRHIHIAVVNAIKAARECKRGDKQTGNMPRWKSYGSGNGFRAYMYVIDYLSSVQSTNPFRAYAKARAQLYHANIECSMLTASAASMASMLKSAQAQIDGDGMLDSKKKSKIRVRHMFSRLRTTWAHFYHRRANSKLGMLNIACHNLGKALKSVVFDAKNNRADDNLVFDLLQGMVIEVIWEFSASLAYKYAEIKVVDLTLSGDLRTDLDKYREWLTRRDATGEYVWLRRRVVVDLHKEKLKKPTALKEELEKHVGTMIGACKVGDQVNAYVKRLMSSMYLTHKDKVLDSVAECMRLDRDVVINLPGYDRVIPEVAAEPEAAQVIEADASDLQPMSLGILGADADDEVIVEYDERVNMVSFQLGECQDKFLEAEKWAHVNDAIKFLCDKEILNRVLNTDNWQRLSDIATIGEGACSGGARILDLLVQTADLEFLVVAAKAAGYEDKPSMTLMTS
jgi:hypothetical protein